MKLNFCYVLGECRMSGDGSRSYSVADELMKFKELLDMGAITQDEFDLKKKELLSIQEQAPETEDEYVKESKPNSGTQQVANEKQEEVNKAASMWLLGSALESIGGCLGTLGTVCIIITVVVLIILFL